MLGTFQPGNLTDCGSEGVKHRHTGSHPNLSPKADPLQEHKENVQATSRDSLEWALWGTDLRGVYSYDKNVINLFMTLTYAGCSYKKIQKNQSVGIIKAGGKRSSSPSAARVLWASGGQEKSAGAQCALNILYCLQGDDPTVWRLSPSLQPSFAPL